MKHHILDRLASRLRRPIAILALLSVPVFFLSYAWFLHTLVAHGIWVLQP
jgi:hypothetical protein